jgi:predicted DnaQ family exonuclease/DinG family helicase
MSGFDSFVTIDLETTGLDPAKCEILELGAVRYVNGKPVEQFSELVKPAKAIPSEITRLTGITRAMVKTSPSIDLIFDKYQKLLDGSPWIVGHNVSFDLGFLKGHMTRAKFALLEPRTMDTGVLSRILFPRLARYSLGSLVGHFRIARQRAHRALEDCMATAEIYLMLIAHLASLDEKDRDSIGRLLFGAESLEYFQGAIGKVKAVPAILSMIEPIETEREADIYPDNIVGEPPVKKYDDYVQIDTAAVENCFLPGGLISKQMPFYEYRTQQAKMAMKVAETFNRSEFLLCEAPTGVGKSLAYLLPASWWASQNHERVVISTQTKSLQSQLFYKDLPQIQEAVDYKFQATLLKGKGNYVCLLKYSDLLPEAELSFDRRDRESLAALALWIENTKTGDISECSGFIPSQNFYIWSRISCDGSFCLGPACRFADKCFLLKVRREAANSQIVVTNHHLTFADFASGGELALGAGNIIFDEAHNLEKTAASYLGNVVDKRALDAILTEMYSSRPTVSGFLANLRASLQFRSGSDDLVEPIDSAIEALIKVNYASLHFFENVKVQTRGVNDEAREIPYTPDNNPCAIDEREELIDSLKLLAGRLDDLVEQARDRENLPKRRENIVRLESFATDINNYGNVAADVLYAANDDYVYWAEKPQSARQSPRFVSAPLDVGNVLDKRLYDHLKTTVFTSATLTVEKRFDYIQSRLGLDSGSKDRITTVRLDSPFDIDKQVAVIAAGYLPSPKTADFETAANQSLETILQSGAKKAMVLFTSHRSLRNSAEFLREPLEQAGIELFHQESSHSNERVFRRFKAAKQAILLGTDTFWEGVDLPGELLELLILFKLPFTVPNRPWFKANLERIEKNGESSFAKLSLPEAVVKFRQGFGRLIRTASDRGCVVILDSRVTTSSFGRTFLNSVGGKKYGCRSAEEISKIIQGWLGTKG